MLRIAGSLEVGLGASDDPGGTAFRCDSDLAREYSRLPWWTV